MNFITNRSSMAGPILYQEIILVRQSVCAELEIKANGEKTATNDMPKPPFLMGKIAVCHGSSLIVSKVIIFKKVVMNVSSILKIFGRD